MHNDLLNSKQAAELAGISRFTLNTYAQQGQLERVMLGRRSHFHRSDIVQLVAQRKTEIYNKLKEIQAKKYLKKLNRSGETNNVKEERKGMRDNPPISRDLDDLIDKTWTDTDDQRKYHERFKHHP